MFNRFTLIGCGVGACPLACITGSWASLLGSRQLWCLLYLSISKASNSANSQWVWKMSISNSPTLLVEMWVGIATMENSMEVPQKTKDRVTIWSSNPTPGHISKENYKSKRYRSSCCGSVEIHVTNIHEDLGSIHGLTRWVKNPVLPWAVV